MKKYKRDIANDVTTFLLELESDLELFEWKIEDLYVWQLIRVFVYSKIREDFTLGEKTFSDKWRYFFDRILVNSILKFPFLNFSKKDSLVFESSRKYLVDGNYIDIYTKYVCDHLRESKKSYQKYQSSYSFDRLDKNIKGVSHLDSIVFLSKLSSFFINVNILTKDLEKITTIENLILKNFDVIVDLKTQIINSVKKYKSEFPFYKYLLRIKSPKEIFIVDFNNNAALISAAKKRSIKVTEVQHGLIVKEDLIYHYPNVEKNSLEYFPDCFYAWDKTWGNSITLPISDDHIISWGNKHIESQARLFNKKNKKNNILLFISQPGLTDDIFKIILDNVDELSDYKIIVKLHPIEFNTFETSKYYTRLENIENIEFIQNEKSIYYLFSVSEVCFGVYSTSLIESLYFNLKLVLLNLNGVEMLNFLIANKKAQLLSKPFNLKRVVK